MHFVHGQPASWVGRKLAGERYEVLSLLAEGGMGTVFRALDRQLNAEVALKTPRASLLVEPEFVIRFEREVRALVRLTHPHVVRVLDYFDHSGVPVAVLQYLSGGTLADRLPTLTAARPHAEAMRALSVWLPPVAEALDFIHAQGYLHRDIKPANVLFDQLGQPYIGDFGIARAMGRSLAAPALATLTAAGLVIGTPEYLAPELVMGSAADGRADQYSLAVTVYEWLAGVRPLVADGPGAMLVAQATQNPRPLTDAVPGLPAALSNCLARALAKAPVARFASCRELAQAVLLAADDRHTTVGPAAPRAFPAGLSIETPSRAADHTQVGPVPPAKVRRRRAVRRRTAVVAVITAGALAAIVWRLGRADDCLIRADIGRIPAGATVRLDGQAIDPAALHGALLVTERRHEVELVADGWLPSTVEIAAAPGVLMRGQLPVDFQAEPTPPARLRIAPPVAATDEEPARIFRCLQNVDRDNQGRYWVAWSEGPAEGNARQMRYRRFSASGEAFSPSQVISTLLRPKHIDTGQLQPSVACDATGRAIFLWTGVANDLGLPLVAQWFDTNGQPQGNAFELGGDDQVWAVASHVALSSQGALLLAYEVQDRENTADAWAREVAPAERLQSEPFRVSMTTNGGQHHIIPAFTSDGGVCFAWFGFGPGDGHGVFGRYRDPSGTFAGPEFLINASTVGLQNSPTCGLSSAGDWLVGWKQPADASTPDAPAVEFLVRWMRPDGTPLGTEYPLFQTERRVRDVEHPLGSPFQLAMDPWGGFAVVWDDARGDERAVILLQRFDAVCRPREPPLVVSAGLAGVHHSPTLEADPQGGLFVVWTRMDEVAGTQAVITRRLVLDGP